LWIASCAIVFFSLNACDKTIGVDDELKPTKLTVEQQKQKIEDNGIAFLDKMDGMKETVAYKTMTDFVEENASKASPQMRQLLAAMESKNLKNINVLSTQLKSVKEDDDDVWGEWLWDADVEDFEKVKDLTDKIIVKFPAADSKTNNAELTVNYTESKVEIPDADEYYPSDVTCQFKVDGSMALEAGFHGTYKTDGTPTSATNTLKVGDYKWEATLKNDSKVASETYEFTYKSETLIKMKGEINGDLTYGSLEEAVEDEEAAMDMLSSGEIYFQMMDLAILGSITDLQKMIDEVEDLEDSNLSETDEEEYYAKSEEIINKYVKLWACFVDDKRKFADVEFYFEEFTETYFWLI